MNSSKFAGNSVTAIKSVAGIIDLGDFQSTWMMMYVYVKLIDPTSISKI
jgi:hypothetical protein